MPDHLGGDMRRVKEDGDDKDAKIQGEAPFAVSTIDDASLLSTALDAGDIALLKTYVSQ